MKLLITGANGFLGQHLVRYFQQSEHEVIALSRGASRLSPEDLQYLTVDIEDEMQVQNAMEQIQPDIIIHTAAMSKPDECEYSHEKCMAINVEAVAHLLKQSSDSVQKFILLSTDFVFGENGPHGEDDLTDPLNFYGKSKLMAEELLTEGGVPYAIVRPVFMYGQVWEGMRNDFLHWVRSSLEQHKKIRVVNDQLRTPTYVGDICKGISTIIERDCTGIYHLAGKDYLSPYGMAVAVARHLGLGLDESLIEPVDEESFPEKVRRAKRSGLKIEKAMRDLDYQPVNFAEGLRLTFDKR